MLAERVEALDAARWVRVDEQDAHDDLELFLVDAQDDAMTQDRVLSAYPEWPARLGDPLVHASFDALGAPPPASAKGRRELVAAFRARNEIVASTSTKKKKFLARDLKDATFPSVGWLLSGDPMNKRVVVRRAHMIERVCGSAAQMQLPSPLSLRSCDQEVPELRQVRRAARSQRRSVLLLQLLLAMSSARYDERKLGYYCDACFDARHPAYRMDHAWCLIQDDVNQEQEWVSHVARFVCRTFISVWPEHWLNCALACSRSLQAEARAGRSRAQAAAR